MQIVLTVVSRGTHPLVWLRRLSGKGMQSRPELITFHQELALLLANQQGVARLPANLQGALQQGVTQMRAAGPGAALGATLQGAEASCCIRPFAGRHQPGYPMPPWGVKGERRSWRLALTGQQVRTWGAAQPAHSQAASTATATSPE